MTNVRELMEAAKKSLEEDEKEPINIAIKEIIGIERNYYYSSKGSSGKLKEIRDVVTKYSAQKGAEDANK